MVSALVPVIILTPFLFQSVCFRFCLNQRLSQVACLVQKRKLETDLVRHLYEAEMFNFKFVRRFCDISGILRALPCNFFFLEVYETS